VSTVYDFFSSRNIVEISSSVIVNNDELVCKRGKYVGVLPKMQAKVIRETMNLLHLKGSQIKVAPREAQVEILIGEFNELRTTYERFEKQATDLLGLKGFIEGYAPELFDLYVDKGGHCWVVRNEDQKTYGSKKGEVL